MGTNPVIARVAPHFGEEPCISGANGSGTIFSAVVLSVVFIAKITKFLLYTEAEKLHRRSLPTVINDLKSRMFITSILLQQIILRLQL